MRSKAIALRACKSPSLQAIRKFEEMLQTHNNLIADSDVEYARCENCHEFAAIGQGHFRETGFSCRAKQPWEVEF
jgi:hypothetical protein